MASDQPHIAEGVFAINKPPSLSSAQVIRDAQSAFQHSKLFQPWLAREKRRLEDVSHNQKQKRRSWKSRQPMQVKMGHGGTLDPMATGVLILGVGSGTKSLNNFLECTKSYECVVLFGAATDSYDAVGKTVARKDYSHITKEMVEEALAEFRGEIMQKPPIFSALKVHGKKMYEYAREGKELPVEIEARPVEVKELEMVEWVEGGEHDFDWPVEEAPQKEKEVVDQVLKLEDGGADTGVGAKRKRDEAQESDREEAAVSLSSKRAKASTDSEPTMSGALPADSKPSASPPDDHIPPGPSTPPRCPAPACRLRMTTTSGFYVRSLAHDLGAAVGSLALMSSLVRTRQGDFVLGGGGGNVLDYDDLGRGEEIWGKKIEGMLRAWEGKEASGGGKGGKGVVGGSEKEGGQDGKGTVKQDGRRESGPRSLEKKNRRRNSSSADSSGGWE